jgi:cation diffusion facilitator CzcD-associated flavoprotein CzcO
MHTPDFLLTPPATTVSRPDRVYPALTPAQIARVARHGRRREMTPGEVLVEVGGGNSAGQAAVCLEETARHVHLLVRKDGLADTINAA